jgi:hypothetical protein
MGGGWCLLAKESTLPPSAAGGLKRPSPLPAGIVLCIGFQSCAHLTFPDSPYNRAGSTIARRMVVSNDDRSRHAGADSGAEHLTRPYPGPVQVPSIHFVNVQHAIARVQTHHPHLFLLQQPHPRHQKLHRINWRPDLGTFVAGQRQTPAQLERGLETGCPRRAHVLHLHQLRHTGTSNATDVTEPLQQRPSDLNLP